jgi:hypothetical protein
MPRGLVPQSEMLRLRQMVVEMCDNLGQVLSALDREFIGTCIRTTRTFTGAEANRIATLHYNFKNPHKRERKKKNAKKAISVQRIDHKRIS